MQCTRKGPILRRTSCGHSLTEQPVSLVTFYIICIDCIGLKNCLYRFYSVTLASRSHSASAHFITSLFALSPTTNPIVLCASTCKKQVPSVGRRVLVRAEVENFNSLTPSLRLLEKTRSPDVSARIENEHFEGWNLRILLIRGRCDCS